MGNCWFVLNFLILLETRAKDSKIKMFLKNVCLQNNEIISARTTLLGRPSLSFSTRKHSKGTTHSQFFSQLLNLSRTRVLSSRIVVFVNKIQIESRIEFLFWEEIYIKYWNIQKFYRRINCLKILYQNDDKSQNRFVQIQSYTPYIWVWWIQWYFWHRIHKNERANVPR